MTVVTANPDLRNSPTRPRVRGGAFVGLAIAVLLLVGIIVGAPLTRITLGSLVIALMLLLMFGGVPIGIAMICASIVGLIGIGGWAMAAATLQQLTWDAVASWSLNVLPLFVLMGMLLWRGGITTLAYGVARQWLGKVPGGLAIATTFSGALLATSSGSTMGTTFALSRMALPEMLSAGYRASLATGAVAMAGTLGQIVPPSILLIIYAGIVQVPVGEQLLAGLIPGGMLALGFIVVAMLWAVLRPRDAPAPELAGITWRGRFRSLLELLPLLAIILVVIGGMFMGWFTASEAAAIGVTMAFGVSWITARGKRRAVRPMLQLLTRSSKDTIVSVAGLFLILIGSVMLTRVLALSGLAPAVGAFIVDLDLGRVEFLLILIAFYIVLGMFLESLPMILLTVPIFQIPLAELGVDLIWFGIFLVIVCELGLVFPPIGMLSFVVHRIAQNPEVNAGREVRLSAIFNGIMPFVAVAILIVIALIIWPEIVLLLPESMRHAGA